ncbi:hypothetical protein DXA92_07900 [Agathobaculum butyriciproducens]|nr:hypothetical protein DXA94_02795 [Agathobaculum butyriciproducens]RGC60859.1 hypothetical protein DXA92_07900 [Agathobaculum butyriciproducens]
MRRQIANDWDILDPNGSLPRIGQKILVAVAIGEDAKQPVFDRIWETKFLPEFEQEDIRMIVQLWLRHEQKQYDEKITVYWQPAPPSMCAFV